MFSLKRNTAAVVMSAVLGLASSMTLAAVADQAKGTGSTTHKFGPATTIAPINPHVPASANATLNLNVKAGNNSDSSSTTAPVIVINPPTSLTISDGPLTVTDQGATATAEGKVVGAPIVPAGAQAPNSVTKTLTGQVSATASQTAGAMARVVLKDPVTFVRAAPGPSLFHVGLSIDSLSLQATGLGNSTVAMDGATDLTGLGSLYHLGIALSNTGPSVNFTSNSVLGLSDASIINIVLASLLFDPISGILSLTSTQSLFDATIPIPESVNTFDAAATVTYDALAVPEPETYVLLLAGLGLVAMFGRRRET